MTDPNQLWEVDGEAELLSPTPESPTPPEAEPDPLPTPDTRHPTPDLPTPDLPTPDLPPPALRIVEALLFVGGTALTAERACEVIRGLDPDGFRDLINVLNREYRRQNRPYTIRETSDGFVLEVKPAFREVRERMFGSPREVRLAQAAVDVAALIAYQQPVAKSEIDSLRGSDSGTIIRQLLHLGLIAVSRRGEAKEREVFYGTTPRFLEVFGLRGLDELPRIGEAERLG